MKWTTPYNAKSRPRDYEKSNKPSVTLPNAAMSIQTLLERYARGLPIGGMRTPVYNEENPETDEFMNYERMDKIEKIELQRLHQEKIRQMNDTLEDEQKRRRQQWFESEVDKAAEIKSKSLKTPPEANT